MKKQKAKKAGGKKEEKAEPSSAKPDENVKTEPETGPEPESNGADEENAESKNADEEPAIDPNATPSHGRKASLSVQSKMRSSSFRQTGALSPGMFSPDGDTAPEIYRKQATRIEELEKENKRLAKEASDGEKRWKKAEEELEDLRDADGDVKAAAGSSEEVEKLVCAFAAVRPLRIIHTLPQFHTQEYERLLTPSIEKRNCCSAAPELTTASADVSAYEAC